MIMLSFFLLQKLKYYLCSDVDNFSALLLLSINNVICFALVAHFHVKLFLYFYSHRVVKQNHGFFFFLGFCAKMRIGKYYN